MEGIVTEHDKVVTYLPSAQQFKHMPTQPSVQFSPGGKSIWYAGCSRSEASDSEESEFEASETDA